MANTVQGPDTATGYNINFYPTSFSSGSGSLTFRSPEYSDEDVLGVVEALLAIEGISIDSVSKYVSVNTSEVLDLESDPLEFTI
jgi:hypothetical protein